MMTGGFTDFRKAEESEVKIAKDLMSEIAKEAKMDGEIKKFEVKGVKTQVVAGTNYLFHVEADGATFHVKIWGKLDQTFELTSVKKV
eukprot:CAMPEP_0114521438 /NCGR_PEP_ID=MMETSP0109-20121206/20184_1 /TAXON_ID=29199 /ORGANISM="Chlorarachnion reptans, Strain CCCM449" /LENGTH=86 /DNA_ID=CAMNT_0001702539 /DNA_START=44 /DNA_END=304 /DNA_ORIENTATION=-